MLEQPTHLCVISEHTADLPDAVPPATPTMKGMLRIPAPGEGVTSPPGDSTASIEGGGRMPAGELVFNIFPDASAHGGSTCDYAAIKLLASTRICSTGLPGQHSGGYAASPPKLTVPPQGSTARSIQQGAREREGGDARREEKSCGWKHIGRGGMPSPT